jgi:hypothetical protein
MGTKILAPLRIEAQHPDEFIEHLLGLDEKLICDAVRKCRARLREPPKAVDEYLETLLRQGLPATVSWLHDRRDWL